MNEAGTSGLRRSNGVVIEEWLPSLQGRRGARAIAEMRDNDPIVGAILYGIEHQLRAVKWTVTPYDESPESAEHAEFVRSCMDDMSTTWEDFIAEALTKLPFGWSLHEVVYKRRTGSDADPPSRFSDGRIGWRKLPIRAQETLARWEFDDEGGIRGMWQLTEDYSEVFIPIEKALLFRTTVHKNNPEGRSVLRNAYTPWWRRKRLEEYEAIGIERDLAGIPVVRIPAEVIESGGAVYDAYVKLASQLRKDEQAGVVLPSDPYEGSSVAQYDLALLSASGTRTVDTVAAIERYQRQLAMSILADVILLGHERVGSLALAESKARLWQLSLQSQLDEIAAVFNRYEIPRLFRLNGLPVDRLPELSPGDVTHLDLVDLAAVIETLARAGLALFPDDSTEAHFRGLLGLPEADTPDGSPEMSDPARIGGPPTGDPDLPVG